MKHRRLLTYAWLLPLLLFAGEANAWGLVTHTYFAQALLWASPLLDPRFRQAIQRFPTLVMAGACLPDIALVTRSTPYTHGWSTAHHLLQKADTEQELAISIGYVSHLYVDVIAHHHFVPAHEAMWFEKGLVSHIISEWAMDAYVSPLCQHSPRALLTNHGADINAFLGKCFPQQASTFHNAVKHLGWADALLRTLRLPQLLLWVTQRLDARIPKHFSYYLAQTHRTLSEFERVLQGHHPGWAPENHVSSATELSAKRLACLEQLVLHHPGPMPYFVKKTIP